MGQSEGKSAVWREFHYSPASGGRNDNQRSLAGSGRGRGGSTAQLNNIMKEHFSTVAGRGFNPR
jgi:hypothetical protein